jgi:predicted DNA-binding protein YlxM (UPF0122 family)
MATKTRVVLELNTRLKVIHACERDKLSVKQIMKMFNIGKTQVYKILKKKTEILKRWETCANGKIKRELKKTQTKHTSDAASLCFCGTSGFVSLPYIGRRRCLRQTAGKMLQHAWIPTVR